MKLVFERLKARRIWQRKIKRRLALINKKGQSLVPLLFSFARIPGTSEERIARKSYAGVRCWCSVISKKKMLGSTLPFESLSERVSENNWESFRNIEFLNVSHLKIKTLTVQNMFSVKFTTNSPRLQL